MFRLLILLALYESILSATMQTSLCCCGCTEPQCPEVGSACRSPREKCISETDLMCSELQQLWEDTHGKPQINWSMDQAVAIDVADPQTSRNSSKRLIDDEVAVVTENGDRGVSTWKETVALQGVPRATSPNKAYDALLEQATSILRNQKNSPEESESETQPQWTDVSEKNSEREAVSDVIPIFEKLEALVTELQKMVKEVKQDVLKRSIIRQAQASTDMESATEPVSEEMEKKVIEDVIEHMKKSFVRAARGTKAINEIDSSVSASAVDVQLPLGRLPIAIRHKRAHGDEPKRSCSEVNSASLFTPTATSTAVGEDVIDESRNCNDPKLKQLILNNINNDAPTSKRAIQKAAEMEFGGTFDVICSTCEFSFVISSQKYCDGIKDQIACFVFLQPPTGLTAG